MPDTVFDEDFFFDDEVSNSVDTIPGNTSTTFSMGTNATFNGTLETFGGRDWVRIELTAGEGIQINLDGAGGTTGALADPYLYLLDSNGDVVAQNDDANGRDSELTYAITTLGTYYIEAGGYDDDETGNYVITTQTVTPHAPLDSIAWGTVIEGDTDALTDVETVNVYFATSGETFDGYTSEGFNAYERAQILQMMDDLSDLVNLDFNVVTDADDADLQLVLDLNEISNEAQPYLGYFNPPGTDNAGVGVFNGDLWDRTAGSDLEQGGYGYVTVVHELLHGLGMSHPHDTGGSSVVMDGVTSNFDDYGDFDLNQGIFTVMTYNSGYFTGTDGSAPANPSGGDFGFEGGAMALDIAYLQLVYGANTSHAGGDTTYDLAHENESGTYWEAIWDTGGTDTIRHTGSDAATIDLRAATLEYENGGGGHVSAVNGVAGGFTIANNVEIENAIGGSGADRLIGNDADNRFYGNSGNDYMTGGDGDDRLYGDGSRDSLYGQDGDDRLYGGNSDDRLYGGSGTDRLYGGNADDRAYGGTGRDRLVGQNGDDRLYGGNSDDRLYGSNGSDRLYGGNGDDRAYGGIGGDRLYGNNGEDYMTGGDGNDRLYGNDGDDALFGNDGRDRLVGQDGDDRLTGGSGGDQFFGGEGTDVMTGGTGRDVFAFTNATDSVVGRDRDQITDFDSRYDTINLSSIDANSTTSSDDAFTFIGDDRFSDTAGELRFMDHADGVIVTVDIDGDGANDFQIMVLGVDMLDASDFVL